MSGRSGFGISISATDSGASAVIDKLNKGIQSLTASGERTGKALEKFGEVSGINKLNEGMQGLRRTATDTFRAIDQTGSSLGALIAPLTVAGVVELTRRWGAFGQSMTNMAYRLQLPVEALSRLQNAARLAGVPAEAMTGALAALQEKLYGAAWNTDPAAVHILRDVLKIDPGAPGHVKNTAAAFAEVAEALKKVGDPHTKQLILDALGWDRALIPLLDNYQKFQKDADATGANITKDQAAHATALMESWDRLSLDLEGIYNKILDSWSGTITKAVSASSTWIEANKETAKSITEIGSAVGAIALLKPAAWVLRLLGLGGVASAAGTAAVLASPLALSGSTAQADMGPKDLAEKAGKDWSKLSDAEKEVYRKGYNERPGVISRAWEGSWLQRGLHGLGDRLLHGPEDVRRESERQRQHSDAGRPTGNQFAGPGVPTGDLGPGKSYVSWNPSRWYHPPGMVDETQKEMGEDLKRIGDTLERMEGEGGLGGGGRRGGSGGSGIGSSPLTVPKGPTAAAGNMRTIHDYFRGKGMSEQEIAGVLVNASAESGFDPSAWGDNGTSYGVFQHHGSRLEAMQRWSGSQTPSLNQQLDYTWMELQTSKSGTLAALHGSTSSGQAGAVWSSGFEAPGGGAAEGFRRGAAAPQFESAFQPPPAAPHVGALPSSPAGAPGATGHVQVDVHLRGAPPGTQANVTTSGRVRAAPPRVETPLPHAA
jgi:hypothetical protein